MSQNENELILERFEDWLTHPVTVALIQHLRSQRESLKEAWASGQFTRGSIEADALLNANAVGQAEVLESLIYLQPEQLQKEKHE